jgi:hypothetical protein
MHDSWGTRAAFDSGGFFVQQGKIRYDQLFFDLTRFCEANDWAETYVLPDLVPTSRSTPAEVEERVQVTIGEGIKFYKRLPTTLRSRALGVLHGHQPRHQRGYFDAFIEEGLTHLGFGSFDTAGRNSEINLLTNSARQRLGFDRDLMRQLFVTPRQRGVPSLHLFRRQFSARYFGLCRIKSNQLRQLWLASYRAVRQRLPPLRKPPQY